jgi:hypothetical protein
MRKRPMAVSGLCRRLPVAELFFMTLVACGVDPIAITATPRDVGSRVSSNTSRPSGEQRLSYDDELSDLNRVVPGFAGFQVDSTGELIVLVAGDAQRVEKEHWSFIDEYVRRNRWDTMFRNAAHPSVRSVKYEAQVLLDARAAVDNHSAFAEALLATDFDEVANQVHVIVRSSKDVKTVSDFLLGKFGDAAAFRVTVGDEARALQTLRGTVPPLRGGMVVLEKQYYFRDCTVGPMISMYQASPAILWVALTNSHCTSTTNGLGPTNGDSIFQGDTYIGREIVDAPTFVGGACPVGRRCRRADLAVIAIEPGVWALKHWRAAQRVGNDPARVFHAVSSNHLRPRYGRRHGELLAAVRHSSSETRPSHGHNQRQSLGDLHEPAKWLVEYWSAARASDPSAVPESSQRTCTRGR